MLTHQPINICRMYIHTYIHTVHTYSCTSPIWLRFSTQNDAAHVHLLVCHAASGVILSFAAQHDPPPYPCCQVDVSCMCMYVRF